MYNNNNFSKNWSNEVHNKDSKTKLIGSWKVEVGDQDQYGEPHSIRNNNNNNFHFIEHLIIVHIWSYDGWKHASEVLRLVRNDTALNNLIKEQEPYLRSRQNQFMLGFSFWPTPEPQVHNNFYEMRSYVLKVGHFSFSNC